jgi:hypothetical protein
LPCIIGLTRIIFEPIGNKNAFIFLVLNKAMFLRLLMNSANRSKIIVTAALVVAVAVFYDSLFDILLSLLHSLFELIEHALDILIEILFHSSPYTTEIIVFYILFFISALLAYIGTRAMPAWYSRFMDRLLNAYHHAKANALNYWQSQSLVRKIQCVSLGIPAVILLFIWLFN